MKAFALALMVVAAVPLLAEDDPGSASSIPTFPDTCREGSIGSAAETSFVSLSANETSAIVFAAAQSVTASPMTIAVVDRGGRVLALYRQAGAIDTNDDLAIGVARTAAFFSHNQAPLSSRTVRFISGTHFPPGVVNAPNAALYGIENTNRGCDLHVTFNADKQTPPALSVRGGGICNPSDSSGCGPGIVTGKVLPDDRDSKSVLAGGIPLYRIPAAGLQRANEGIVTGGQLVGGIGVVGAGGDSDQFDEYAAVTGAFGSEATGIVPVPSYPLPEPGNVFIDGIRLPFLGPDQRLKFNDDGLPIGLQPLAGLPAPAGTAAGNFVIGPNAGGCAANQYLAGPVAGSKLSAADVDAIVQRAIAAAKRTRGAIRLPLNSYARMTIAVADLDGTLLAIYRMPDTTVFSTDVAVAKSRNVVFFSTNTADLPGVPAGTAVTNRTIGFGAQPLFPPGIDSRAFKVRQGPFYPLFLKDLTNPCTQGSQLTNPNQNGIVFFPGATPLYRNGTLIGGLGISGDGVEQDDYVTVLAAGDLLPKPQSWADRIFIDHVRLPMFKFPRHPEGVTECGGTSCD